MAARIDVLFGKETLGNPGNIVLHGVLLVPHGEREMKWSKVLPIVKI